MAASGRSSGGDDDGVLLRPPPPPSPCSSQPTCWELLSTDSKTPNPRPTKTMRIEESSDPPPYEVVFSVDDEESSEEKPKGEGRAEPEETIEYDTDEDMEGWGYLPSGAGAEPDVKKKQEEESESETEEEKAFWAGVVPIGEGRAESVRIEYDTDDDMGIALVDIPSPEVKKFNICWGDHYTCNCSYLSSIPYGMKVPNDKDYIILCLCGRMCLEGGKCGDRVCLMTDRSVAPRSVK